ncbi:MAG: hypothetical protein EBR30_00840 [Cytophagia bacterium]|nr:hypothetical protein [Cytophagia bacterium]NBW33581.1 hypothetical protein [Cytophagia bacterium]
MTLPVVAFNITSISRDNNRVFNKLEGTYNLDIEDSSKNRHTLQPVPINIAVNISILARFQTDMDQIISNFVPYTDPYFIISWSRDGIPDKEIRTEVLWSGTLNMTYPTDLNNNQPARVACDTSFTIKGWLFKADSDVVGRIFKIENNFYATDEVPANDRNAAALAKIKAALSGTNYTETRVVSAVPQPQLISLYLTPVNNSGSVSIFGSSLQYVNAVYLSGSNSSMFTNTITVSTFANVPSLSAQYPTITGVIPATSFVVESDNKITVSYPAPATTGIMNVFLFNEAGYADILP